MCENLNGKKIAVLGIKEVGKTTFLNYICKNEILKDYKRTLYPDKVGYKKFSFSRGDISFTLSSVDLPGSTDGDDQAVNAWKKHFDSANIVIYLLRADVLLNPEKNDDAKREVSAMERDIALMRKWREQTNKNRKVFIVGSHCDKLDKFSEQLSRYENEFLNNKDIKVRALGMIPVIGSLVNEDEAEKLIQRLVNQW